MKKGFLRKRVPSGLLVMVGRMQANAAPWCLRKQTAKALVRRGLARKEGRCEEHGGPTYVLTKAGSEVSR